jgi:predicted MFS family arabinose efflux permease
MPQIGVLLVTRFVLNTSFRLLYPLLAFLAAGFGVSLETVSLLVTVQVGATLLSPLGGTLSDARGENVTMLSGLACFCLGTLVCALAPSFPLFLLGYALMGLATALYHPSAQAYASARTVYALRARVLGLLELSWALAALVGVTTLSQLATATNSPAPIFWVLLAAGLAVLAFTATLPSAQRATRPAGTASGLDLRVLARPNVAAALPFLFCVMCSIEMIWVVYAGWLQADFRASTEQLALVFGLIGFGEVAGSLGVALFADRLGKRRMLLAGFVVTGLLQLLLPLSSGNWGLFLPLFLLYATWVEFAIVAIFPLLSELAPLARGTVLSFGVASIGLGRVVGSLVAPRIWADVGFAPIAAIACALVLAGVVICRVWVREG